MPLLSEAQTTDFSGGNPPSPPAPYTPPPTRLVPRTPPADLPNNGQGVIGDPLGGGTLTTGEGGESLLSLSGEQTTTGTEPSIGAGDDNVSLQDLYPTQPEVDAPRPAGVFRPQGADVIQADSTVAEVSTPGVANLTQEQRVDEELARILGQDSPLMARARAQAAQMSNSRGLLNTSMAVGAAQGAMVDRALPMAQQNAAQGAKRELFNAEQQNQAEQLSAQMRTALERGDQDAYNRAEQQLADLRRNAEAQQADINFTAEQQRADAQNRLNEQQMAQITSLNQQYLKGSQVMDLATIQGTYSQIISTNETAASLYNSYFSAISGVMANPDMTPQQIATAVETSQRMLEASLRMIAEMNNMDFGTGLPAGGGGGGGGIPGGGGDFGGGIPGGGGGVRRPQVMEPGA